MSMPNVQRTQYSRITPMSQTAKTALVYGSRNPSASTDQRREKVDEEAYSRMCSVILRNTRTKQASQDGSRGSQICHISPRLKTRQSGDHSSPAVRSLSHHAKRDTSSIRRLARNLIETSAACRVDK